MLSDLTAMGPSRIHHDAYAALLCNMQWSNERKKRAFTAHQVLFHQ